MAKVANLEKRIILDTAGKRLWQMRKQPAHAAYWLAGVALPPHERFWLMLQFTDYRQVDCLASRGTSKSFSFASMGFPLKALLNKNLGILTLSASGFRGSKELFKDGQRMFEGQLKSQRSPGSFLLASTKTGKVITKDPSIWTMQLRSFSDYKCAPTNNADQLRGLRANVVMLDERAFFDPLIPSKIVRPMLNVGTEFERTAAGGDKNQLFQVSTIDWTTRDWWNELQIAAQVSRDEHAAYHARRTGWWTEYDRLLNEQEGRLRNASFAVTRFDYTDLLIPECVNTLDGERRYRVHYPLPARLAREDVLKWDNRDGRAYWYTYPVTKDDLEKPMRDGSVDPEIWRAEQRNIPISSSGNVFSHELIQMIAERPIWTAAETPGTKRRRKDNEDDDPTQEEFYAPILWSCGDPVVVGIDYARESDESAIVVIRLGELAEGTFDPFVWQADAKGRPLLGQTAWNHVCWAESWKKLTAHDFAAKIRDIYHRYNVHTTVDIGGMAMDKRGGGGAVRDDLAMPKPPLLGGKPDPTWDAAKIMKLFDPHDTDGGYAHYEGFNDPTQYWGGLRLLSTQNEDNIRWTFDARAMMTAKKLYIGYWMQPSRWAADKNLILPNGEPDKLDPEYRKWEVGFNGIRRLKSQLLRLQTKTTETGLMRFVMPGDRTKDEGKRDLAVSLTYAVSLARAHLVARTQVTTLPPMIEPMIVEFEGRALGNSDPFDYLNFAF